MCGIAGFINAEGAPVESTLIKRMCDRIAHRGPDSAGYFADAFCTLGHRRLSIIDLSTGGQPLGNEDGTLQIIFNGEIYNYLELRRELLAKGHRFSTNSDTEAIVHLYEEEGAKTPERLNGMFAFAVWDTKNRTLFAARDRFGKKPFYYSTSVPGLRFCFASELKAIEACPGFPGNVNAPAVADFLSLAYVPDPCTIYSSVQKLGAGESLTATASGIRVRKYWSPEFVVHPDLPIANAIEEIRAIAADSVQRRMIADVPLGGFLSGGVDSSAVIALMAQQARVKSFSIGFHSKEFNEIEFARRVAERYHTDHYEEVVTPKIGDVLDTLVEHFDEPFGDASSIPTLYLARMTRKHVTVALSGDGADELFGGYRRYYFGALEERLRRKFPDWFRLSVFRWGGRYYPKFDYLPRVFRAKTLLGNLSNEIGDAYFTSMSILRDGALDSVLAPELRRDLDGYSPRVSFRERFRKVSHLSPLQQMQAVDLETYLPGDILVKADRATMAFSLESRSPWLDHRLGELSFRLPDECKIDGRIGKFAFKKAVESLVPAENIYRPKMGFSVPLAEWFRTSLKPVFTSLILDSPSVERYLSPAGVRTIWNEHQSGFANHDRKLWNVLMLACWDRRISLSRSPGLLRDMMCG